MPTAAEPSDHGYPPVRAKSSSAAPLWRRYRSDLNKVLDTLDESAIDRVVDRLRHARDSGASVYIAGNGGSAATADHWAADLGKSTRAPGRPSLRVASLTDNRSWLTALANDEGYERVFAGQLENFAKPGDLLIVISASGNSPNLLAAVEVARQTGVFTIGLLGFDGGRLRGMVDEAVWVRTEIGAYGLSETAHTVVADVVTAALIADRLDPPPAETRILQRPTQAVIVAGGRGERLRPLTDDLPKPMIAMNGRPFLEYLVEQLQGAGFERLLILEGYRADSIRDHFGNGEKFGLSIVHRPSPAEWETGRRLFDAADLLDDRFLFLYGDNYWPMPWERLWQRYLQANVAAMVTVYRNADGITRSNVQVDDSGHVIAYDRSRTQPHLSGVEIGYAIMPRSIVEDLAGQDRPLEAAYPLLVARGQLAAFITDHRYYSIGSLERLPATERFLARQPAVILDRDGVLNRRPPQAEYVRSPEDIVWLPGALEALRRLHQAGYLVLVASNQAGIARGAMSENDLASVHERMREDVTAAGGAVEAFYHCPHGWDEGCECRKPRPGLLLQAARDHCLDLTRTIFVGDDERDIAAAEAAGSPWRFVDESHSLLDIVHELVGQHSGYANLPDAATAAGHR